MILSSNEFIQRHLSQGSWVQYPVWQHTFVSPSAVSRRAVVSYWRKYVHEVLVTRLGGLSLSRKSVVRLTDRPDMTLDVYRGRKTTIQYNQRHSSSQENLQSALGISYTVISKYLKSMNKSWNTILTFIYISAPVISNN